MNYPFVCKKCNNEEIISMPIKEYKANGHYCSICGSELERPIESLVCGMSKDNTNSFYRTVN